MVVNIRLNTLVIVKGFDNLKVGIPFDCPVGIARDLIVEGLAEAVEGPTAEELKPQGLAVNVREPVIENRDPQVAVEKIVKRKKATLP